CGPRRAGGPRCRRGRRPGRGRGLARGHRYARAAHRPARRDPRPGARDPRRRPRPRRHRPARPGRGPARDPPVRATPPRAASDRPGRGGRTAGRRPARRGGAPVIVTVTLNPAVDVTYRTPALRPGHSHRVADVVRRAGGKGLNVARVLAAQGYATLAVAPVGGAPGDQIRADLDSSGLPHQLVETGVPTRHTVAVVTDTETTNLNEAGPPLPPESVDALGDVLTDALREATVVVFSGSLPGGTDPSVLTYLLTLVRQAGVPAVVDTSGRALTATAETGARVLKPNRDELLAAVGGTADAGLPQLPAAARRLATRGGGAVFASLGEAGMLAVDGPDAWHGRLDAPLT